MKLEGCRFAVFGGVVNAIFWEMPCEASKREDHNWNGQLFVESIISQFGSGAHEENGLGVQEGLLIFQLALCSAVFQ